MARNVRYPLAASLACAVVVAVVAVLALGVDAGRNLDVRLYARLVEDHPGGDGWADAIAALADPLPLLAMLAVACGIALWRGRPTAALAAVLVVVAANLTTQLLKVLLAHPRVRVVIGGDPLQPNTFPSGHTTAAVSIGIAYAFVVSARWRNLTMILGAVIALGVGCSVVVIGWHLPSDVLAGFLVAAGWGFAVLATVRAVAPRRPEKVRRQSPRPAAISVK